MSGGGPEGVTEVLKLPEGTVTHSRQHLYVMKWRVAILIITIT